MKSTAHAAAYDEALHIEAYQLHKTAKPFPNHFHEYYVIGLVEHGNRALSCNNREYGIKAGSVLLLNPGDSHSCAQSDDGTLDYRGINISKDVMLELAEEVTGSRELPGFTQNVIADEDVACCLRTLHESVMSGSCELYKEEHMLLLLSLLLQRYGQPFKRCVAECGEEIEEACLFMEQHYSEHICLSQLCRHVGVSKSALLRGFAKSKGVTPYRYLENIQCRFCEVRRQYAAFEVKNSGPEHLDGNIGLLRLPPQNTFDTERVGG